MYDDTWEWDGSNWLPISQRTTPVKNNAMAYDLESTNPQGPIVFLDIGTQATDVVIAEEEGHAAQEVHGRTGWELLMGIADIAEERLI